MIKGGYIIQPRKIKHSEVYRMPPCTREVWQYILREAFFVDKGDIKRGQFFTKIDIIREDLKWFVGYRQEMYSRRQTEGALEGLRKVGMIVTTKVTHGIIITVCKYDYYQNLKNYEGNSEGNNEDFTKVLRRDFGRVNINKEGIKKEESINNNTIVRLTEKNFEKNGKSENQPIGDNQPQGKSIWTERPYRFLQEDNSGREEDL